ncbi:general amidase [Schizopora paradoxa]|uniref:amidase n=1 Tax=Schizopora paradoxa TaxID=27342 RepID=A0A0H2S8M7_9AGAM|nr:general amidase [Schizopora paradoxa]
MSAPTPPPNWQALCTDKRARQLAQIPKEWLLPASSLPPAEQLDVSNVPRECGVLTARELEITEIDDVSVLLAKLASVEWSAVEVVTAFYKRAIVAHQVVNCLTEIFVERALARAQELDAHLAKTGKPIGPLHGLPISLKDQIRMKGLETTMGYASWIGDYSDHDSVLVTLLYEAGANPFVRSNVPQTLMWPETYNHIFGRTVNPYNRKLTSGGSSGGEGALISMKGSPLGVGSDIGGSIRIPSALCGIYGMRPSYGRVPYAGCTNSMEGQDSVPSVLGPLSRSLSGIKAFMQTIISSKPWERDPLAIRKAWDEEGYQLRDHGGDPKGLVFAILWDNSHVVPHPPITRGLEETKKALERAGHKVVDWPAFPYAKLSTNLGQIWNAAATDDYRATTNASGEPIITSMEHETDSLSENAADATVPDFRPAEDGLSAYHLWQLQKEKTALRVQHLAHWQATSALTGTGRPVDAIISPVVAYAAPPHGRNKNRSANYTMVFNSLDYACCVFPVSKVDPSIDVRRPAHSFYNEFDKTNYEFYDPERFKGAPISLQLVGGTHEEEAVIAMTEVVDKALKEYKATPLS